MRAITDKGLTNNIEPCSKLNFSSKGIAVLECVSVYSAHVPFPPGGAKQATFLPNNLLEKKSFPVAITIPLPSNPATTGNFLGELYNPLKKAQSEGLGGTVVFTKIFLNRFWDC